MTYNDYAIWGPPAAVAAAVAGKANVIGPRIVTLPLALELGLSLGGVDLSAVLASPRAFARIRCAEAMAVPADCQLCPPADARTVLGEWS